LIGVALRILLLVGVMQIMGIQLTLFTAIAGAFGVAVGLALGYPAKFRQRNPHLAAKAFRCRRQHYYQGMEGTVTAIEIFYTMVTTFDNRMVIVPNSKLSNEVIIILAGRVTGGST
jgi:small conductance mechanosensitive channel